MSTVDQVTDFKLDTETGEQVKVKDLVTAVEKHIRALFEDCEGFSCPVEWNKNQRQEIPERFRWLVAFAVEGESEADYVHFGALIQRKTSWDIDVSLWGTYVDFGFTKVWGGSARAREIAAEVQRFLNAARWN